MPLRFTLELEDTLVTAERSEKDWRMTFIDQFGNPDNSTNPRAELDITGKVICNVSDEQVSAILALAMGAGENDWEGYDVPKLYEIANQVCGKLPTEIRPIP